MKQSSVRIIILLIAGVLMPAGGFCLSGADTVRLKKAGIEDQTIQLIIQEKTVETRAYTVEEIVAMKKAGINNATLRMLIAEKSFMKKRQPLVYGKNTQPLSFTTVNDIIALKEAGISDNVIQAILLVIRDEDNVDTKRAWRMLNSMGIIVDQRRGHGK